MFLPKIDWLAVWKIYHWPFFWAYTVVSFAIRLLTLRRLNLSGFYRNWLISSTASLIIVPAAPFLTLPSFLVVSIVAGLAPSVYSLYMAVPIAISLACAGAAIDLAMHHMVLREAVDKKRMWFLIGTNLLVTAFAMAAVLAVMMIHPPEIIAVAFGSANSTD